MFTGPNKSKRTTLVSNLLGRGSDVVVRVRDNEVFFAEDATRFIYTIRPKAHQKWWDRDVDDDDDHDGHMHWQH